MKELEKKLEEILLLEWTCDEKKHFKDIIKNMLWFKKFLSKSFEKDILDTLDICIREKKKLDDFKKSCHCSLKVKE
jgi:archaellum component FlaD/FlaE